jgi:YndJ-like protein
MRSQVQILVQVLIGAGALVAVPLGWVLLKAVEPTDPIHRLARAAAASWLVLSAIWVGLAIAGSGALNTPRALRWPTPAHFLYAGFALTAIAITADRAHASRLSRAALLGQLGGVPLLAVEIGFAPELQWTGALVVGTAAALVALEQARGAGAIHDEWARGMLLASSAALAAGMILAVGYGLSTRFGFQWLSIDSMALTHGVLNTVGFSLLALLGWRRALARQPIQLVTRNSP